MFSSEYIKKELTNNGYIVIENILNKEEIDYCRDEFFKWKSNINDHDYLHNLIDPHGIYKYFKVGHTRYAWFIRTHVKVQEVFKKIWETDELVVSFDGSCYLNNKINKVDNCWTHTDQASNCSELKCYQGLVSLTDNIDRTLVVYEGSNNLHKKYFEERNITNSRNWNKICPKYLESIKDCKRVLNIKAGSLVLWDSRTFHQNQYGKLQEERLVQYICFLPKKNKNNSEKMREKRLKYFDEQRTTSHWPYPIKVNGLQPQRYGDTKRVIDYSNIPNNNLEDYMEKILKII